MRTLFAVAVITATILASGCVLAAGAMRLPPTHVIAAIPLVSFPARRFRAYRTSRMWRPSTI